MKSLLKVIKIFTIIGILVLLSLYLYYSYKTEYYRGVDLFNVKGIEPISLFETFNNKYVDIYTINDTTYITTHGVKCSSTKAFTNTNKNIWHSFYSADFKLKGKCRKRGYYEHIFITDSSTITKFVSTNSRYAGLGYKPIYNMIKIESKTNEYIFYQPDWSKLNTKINLIYLKNHSFSYKKIDKTFVNNYYYADVEEYYPLPDSIYKKLKLTLSNSLKFKNNKYTLRYDNIDAYTKYFVDNDKCNYFKPIKLKYKER